MESEVFLVKDTDIGSKKEDDMYGLHISGRKIKTHVNLTFVTGTTNFKLSTLNEHENTDGHKRAIREEENDKAVAAGVDLAPRIMVQETPASSAIRSGFKKMGDKEKEALTKLHAVAHYTAVKRRPNLDFKDLIELEKLHGFQSGAYENESACRDFIKNILEFFFQRDLYEKLLRVNFITILCTALLIRVSQSKR